MNETKAIASKTFIGIEIGYLLSEWKQMFSKETIPKDIWAGLTVALVALPLNLALAIAAGVEPGVGVTTGIIAGIIGALFGGQRVAITGPAAAMAVVLIELARNYGIDAIWLVCLIAGVFQLLAGVFKLGRFISFLPMPVIVGFANAIGVLVFCNALDDFFGLPAKQVAHAGQPQLAGLPFIPEFILDMLDIWRRCLVHQEMNFYAIVIGTISLLIAYFTPKVTKAVPGQLVAIFTATLLCSLLQFKVPVVKDIATIPNMLPLPRIPELTWNDFGVLFPTAITVFMLGSIESLLSASVADGMTGSSRHHSNQELIGQGLANLVVPFFGGIPVTGVIARTAVNIRAGACTRLSALVHSLALACLIFFLAKYAEQIPLAALASILMLTGIRLIEWDAMSQMWRSSRMESFVAIATTMSSVAVDLTAGVFTGLVFACALFIRQISDVKIVPQGEQEANGVEATLPTCKFVRTYVVDGPLFFGAAERFIENILIVADVKVVILHMKAARVMDLTGVETLLSIRNQLERQGGKLVIAELPQQPLQLLEKSGALEKIGRENIYSSYHTAVISVNEQLLGSSCRGCEEKGGYAPKDCRLHNAMLDESSPMARLVEAARGKSKPVNKSGLEWLFPVLSTEEVPEALRGTPLETLLKGQNLGLIDEHQAHGAALLIGMCIDFRNALSIPRDWAYIVRREGANMAGAVFAVALALSKGVRYMALIAHNNCAMANTSEHREQFIDVLTKGFSWESDRAVEFFDSHSLSREIGNELDFVVEEADRIEKLFPGLKVVPLLFRVEDSHLYLIYDWLVKNAPNYAKMSKFNSRDTGEFTLPT